MNFNILFILLIVVTLFKVHGGYKRGLVKEVISLTSLIVLGGGLVFLFSAISKYQTGRRISTVLLVFFIVLVIVLHFLLGLALFPAKLAAKLPIVKGIDKLCGALLGATEGVLILWLIYAFAMIQKDATISQMIFASVEESSVLLWLYQHNYLAYFLEQIGEKIFADFVLYR